MIIKMIYTAIYIQSIYAVAFFFIGGVLAFGAPLKRNLVCLNKTSI